ncbi:MAG: hypothetical protein OXS28_02290 [Gammaproteobacteria bacterium]|nr:hypothetical protein [Gammaproteobacteria bacterium]
MKNGPKQGHAADHTVPNDHNKPNHEYQLVSFPGWINPELSARLQVIKYFLRRNQEAEEELKQEIDDLFEQARQGAEATKGLDPPYQDEWLVRMEETYYLDAVHSTAAVGLLAPFVEALYDAMNKCYRDQVQQAENDNPHQCGAKARAGNIPRPVARIIQLAELINLARFFPDDYAEVLGALFHYRNKMLHCGFVWSKKDRDDFKQKFENNLPEDWFECMDRGDEESYVIYMTNKFIKHCLQTIDDIMKGVEEYYRSVHQEKLKIIENMPESSFFNLIQNRETK